MNSTVKVPRGRVPAALKSLNAEQRAAAEATDGPVLILAGAGSGKTRVIAHRIAYLIDKTRAKPHNILAVTFTNKAAGEMRERILKLVGDKGDELHLGTFHSICARLLRRDGHRIGYDRNFSIYDSDDQGMLVKKVMQDLGVTSNRFPPNAVRVRISNAKNAFESPEQFRAGVQDIFEEKVADVFEEYQRRLLDNNAMDFDDLLIKPIQIFEQHPAVLKKYQDLYRYIHVDEYQDTNRAQYLFASMLAQDHRNLCVVGDDDQSIYGWRGADIRNILEFERDYPDCQIFRLERNYRSTGNILGAANCVVSKNNGRKDKTLWTDRDDGPKVQALEVSTAQDEASEIVERIKQDLMIHKLNFKDFAILYRTNAQSRVLEDGLRRNGINYVIVGGVRFYERKEVKDVLAYLRVICNPLDTISFRRIINYPARGIGDSSFARLEDYCFQQGISFFTGLSQVDQITEIPERIRAKIKGFYEIIQKYMRAKNSLSACEVANALMDEIGILRQFKDDGSVEAMTRHDNVMELLNAIAEFSRGNAEVTLEDFLEQVALMTDVDTWDDRSNSVTLMTLHSAKGLEFPVVYITGLEEGLFPISRSLNALDDLEEERRLFYVGITRAQERVYLSFANSRRRFGENSNGLPSRFLREIGEEFIEFEAPSRARRYAAPQRRRPLEQVDKMPAHEDFSQEVRYLEIGCAVQHPTFGNGRVTGLDGEGERLKATVTFDGAGTKRLMVKFANLEIV